MNKNRIARCLFFSVLLFAAADPGCQLFHHNNTVSVLVRDAETKQPITGATVKLMCLSAKVGQHPPETSGATGGDGVVRLASAADADGALLEGGAKGYLTEETSLPPSVLQPAKTAVNYVLEVYTEPGATVELVVPTGYHGPVKAEVEIQPDFPTTHGQRSFRYQVSPAGVAQIKGPPLLRHLRAADYHASYADGTPLPQPKDTFAVGLRWLKCEGRDEYFVVGTEAEWLALHRLEKRSSGDDKGSGDGKKGGGGGGGGRGHHRGGGGD